MRPHSPPPRKTRGGPPGAVTCACSAVTHPAYASRALLPREPAPPGAPASPPPQPPPTAMLRTGSPWSQATRSLAFWKAVPMYKRCRAESFETTYGGEGGGGSFVPEGTSLGSWLQLTRLGAPSPRPPEWALAGGGEPATSAGKGRWDGLRPPPPPARRSGDTTGAARPSQEGSDRMRQSALNSPVMGPGCPGVLTW